MINTDARRPGLVHMEIGCVGKAAQAAAASPPAQAWSELAACDRGMWEETGAWSDAVGHAVPSVRGVGRLLKHPEGFRMPSIPPLTGISEPEKGLWAVD